MNAEQEKHLEKQIKDFEETTKGLFDTANRRGDKIVKQIAMQATAAFDRWATSVRSGNLENAKSAQKELSICLCRLTCAVEKGGNND